MSFDLGAIPVLQANEQEEASMGWLYRPSLQSGAHLYFYQFINGLGRDLMTRGD